MKRKHSSSSGIESYSFRNTNATHNQAGRQTIRGDVHHGPVHHYHTVQNLTVHSSYPYETNSQVREDGMLDQMPQPDHRSSGPLLGVEGAKRLLQPAERLHYKQSLAFSDMESRHATIKSAHSETCEWLLGKAEYLDWLHPDRLSNHGGILWVKGKPGTGKSTIAAFIISCMRSHLPDMTIIAFFLNARGNDLQRSTEGVYRSLLYQLLHDQPRLEAVLNTPSILTDEKGNPRWTVTTLEKMLRDAVLLCKKQCLTLFIDALDECHEDQIRSLVRFLENLSRDAPAHGVKLRIWFSSRHYPHVTIGKGIYLILEDQKGHYQDLVSYVESELEVGDESRAQQLKKDILARASGIFLWVVLVVAILNREHDRGRVHNLKRRLQEVPGDLKGLFHDVLTGQPQEELVLCLQWMLFAKRPLKLDELYFGIRVALEPDSISDWDKDGITKGDMRRFVLDASRGLVEETRDETRTIQLIHESVRNYLLQGTGPDSWMFGPADSFSARSHERLKHCCRTYYQDPDILEDRTVDYRGAIDSVPGLTALRERIRDKFPFLTYAVHQVLFHSNEAHNNGCPQDAFMESFNLTEWVFMYDLLAGQDELLRCRSTSDLSSGGHSSSTKRTPKYSHDRQKVSVGTFLRILAERGLCRLLEMELRRLPVADIHGHPFESAIAAAQAASSRAALEALLSPSDPDNENKSGAVSSHRSCDADLQETVASLLKAINLGRYPSLLLWAVNNGKTTAVKVFLACNKVRVDYVDKFGVNLLTLAARHGYLGIVKLLLSRDEFVADVRSFRGQTPLAQAAGHGHHQVVQFLLGRDDVEADSRDAIGRTPLSRAAAEGRSSVVNILLARDDVNPNSRDYQCGRTPLSWAAAQDHRDVVRLLLGCKGVSPNIGDTDGQTPLLWAAANGCQDVVQLLLRCESVDIYRRDSKGRSPLDWAVLKKHTLTAALLSSTESERRATGRKLMKPMSTFQRPD